MNGNVQNLSSDEELLLSCEVHPILSWLQILDQKPSGLSTTKPNQLSWVKISDEVHLPNLKPA